MLNVYLPSMIVTEVIELKDAVGNIVVPTALEYDVKDETGKQIVVKTPIAIVGSPVSIEVTVPANLNSVSADGRSARVIAIYMTTPEGIIQNQLTYFIESSVTLTVMHNTVQTYEEAELSVFDMGGELNGWAAASRNMKISAMKTAFVRMKLLKFNQSTMRSLSGRTELELRACDQNFQKCLRRAQIAEANIILNGDEIHLKQQQGILSETIGESSMFFRTTFPLNEPLSKPAMSELRGYINRSISIGRG